MISSSSHFYIIDDDLSFGKSLKRLLNARGISADYFGSAQSFFDAGPSTQPGYSVVDIHMPDCDGFELIDKEKNKLTERIKNVVVELVHHSDLSELHQNLMTVIAERLHKDYAYLSRLFSEVHQFMHLILFVFSMILFISSLKTASS